jgi:hypothetical protein
MTLNKTIIGIVLSTLFLGAAFQVQAASSLLTSIEAYYQFQGNSTDATGNGHNGTDTSMSYSAGNGKILQGGGFSSSQIASTITGRSVFSVSCWFKATNVSTGSSQTVWEHRNAGNTTDYDVAVGGTGKVLLESFTPYLPITGATTLTNGVYYNVVAVVNGASSILYLNGVSDGTGTLNTFTAGNNFYIGANAGVANTPFTGSIDECGYWNRTLTQAEVTELYNGGAGLSYPFTPASTFNFWQFLDF